MCHGLILYMVDEKCVKRRELSSLWNPMLCYLLCSQNRSVTIQVNGVLINTSVLATQQLLQSSFSFILILRFYCLLKVDKVVLPTETRANVLKCTLCAHTYCNTRWQHSCNVHLFLREFSRIRSAGRQCSEQCYFISISSYSL